MKKALSLLVSLMLIASMSLFAACGGNGSTETGSGGTGGTDTTDAPVEFTIGFCTWIGYAPLFIAEDQGYFEEFGIAPTLEIIEDESQYAAALYSDSIQALGNVLDREVVHYASGTPETVVFALDESTGGDGVIATADIQTVADLRGKTVGLDKSSTSYFFFLSILEANGVDESEVTIQEMGADDAGVAFIAGNLDAAVVWEPYLTEASNREGGHVLASSADYPKVIVDVMVMRSDFISANPAAAEGLAAAWFKAIDFYRENPDEGNRIMAEGLGLDPEEVAEMAEGITFMGADENRAFFDKGTADNIFEVAGRASDFWADLGLIDSGIDVDAFISTEYYDAS